MHRNNQMNSVKRITVVDIILAVILLAGAVAFVPFMRSQAQDLVVVYRGDTVLAKYPLSRNKVFTVRGRIGAMTIEIYGKSVNVRSSTCPRQICVRHRPISRAFQTIVCAPNHIIVEIQSPAAEKTTDAVNR